MAVNLFTIDEVWDYINDTSSEIESNVDNDNIMMAPSTAPSTAPTALTVTLDKDQPHATKKRKLYKPKRMYIKTSWVWKYMDQENEYDICQVPILNMRNEEIYCGQRFMHDRSTGNMANHLRGKHSIHEEMDKVTLCFFKQRQ